MPACGAHCKSTGKPCPKGAMKNGRCYTHGGAATGPKPTHGRYSHSLPKDLADRYEYFKTDPKILDLQPEIALARSLMERFMGAFVDGGGISAEVGGEMRAWVDQVSKIVERCHKVLYGEQYTVTVEGLQASIAAWCTEVNEAIDSGLTGQKLKDDIDRRMKLRFGGAK